jgi:hypothetical protein
MAAKRKQLPLPLETGEPWTGDQLRAYHQGSQSEGKIQAAIVDALVKLGWEVIRINGGGGYTKGGDWFWCYILNGADEHEGFVDLVAFKRDRYLLLEVKSAKGRLRGAQKDFHARASYKGIQVHTVRSVEAVMKIIGGL